MFDTIRAKMNVPYCNSEILFESSLNFIALLLIIVFLCLSVKGEKAVLSTLSTTQLLKSASGLSLHQSSWIAVIGLIFLSGLF